MNTEVKITAASIETAQEKKARLKQARITAALIKDEEDDVAWSERVHATQHKDDALFSSYALLALEKILSQESNLILLAYGANEDQMRRNSNICQAALNVASRMTNLQKNQR